MYIVLNRTLNERVLLLIFIPKDMSNTLQTFFFPRVSRTSQNNVLSDDEMMCRTFFHELE